MHTSLHKASTVSLELSVLQKIPQALQLKCSVFAFSEGRNPGVKLSLFKKKKFNYGKTKPN